jgi:hypothetical protein
MVVMRDGWVRKNGERAEIDPEILQINEEIEEQEREQEIQRLRYLVTPAI